MMPDPHLADIDIEVLTVLVFLLVSFATWLKEKISRSAKKEEPESSAAQDALREIIWRRQMGEESIPMPWETGKAAAKEEAPAPPVVPRRSTPPPVPTGGREPSRPPLAPIIGRATRAVRSTPPPIPDTAPAARSARATRSATQVAIETPRPKVSEEKQAELARAFEQTSGARARRGARRNALTAALRRPESVRRAILLSEILGPPVALRHEPVPHT